MNEYKRNMDFEAVQALRCSYACNILLTFLLYSEFSFFILFKDTSLCSLKSMDKLLWARFVKLFWQIDPYWN